MRLSEKRFYSGTYFCALSEDIYETTQVVKLLLILYDSIDSFDDPFPAEEQYTEDEVPCVVNELEACLF